MADNNELQIWWNENIEEKQSYEDLMKQLSELEKQIWWDWIIWNWDSVLDKQYENDLKTVIKDWNLLSDKVLILKSILEVFSKDKKEPKRTTIKKLLLKENPNQESEIDDYLWEIPEVIEEPILDDIINKIKLRYPFNALKNTLKEDSYKSINDFHTSKIKKIIREFDLSDAEVNEIIQSRYIKGILLKDNFPKYSSKVNENSNFFSNEYVKEDVSILRDIGASLLRNSNSKLDKNIVDTHRNFSKIIRKGIDPFRMWSELNSNLRKEQDTNNTDDNKQIQADYFADLTKYLKENDVARSIFLEKAEINNPADKDIGFKDGLKIWLWFCDYLSELLWELRIKEMKRKIDKMLDKAKPLYNEEWLKQLELKIIEKVKKDWKDCVIDYVKFLVDFDKEAIEKWWTNKLRKTDEKTHKVIPLNEKQVWANLLEILKSEVDENRSELTELLLKYNLSNLDLSGKTDEETTKILKDKWVIDEDINKVLSLNFKNTKNSKQIIVLEKFNSLSSENQSKFLNNFEELKKEWKDPSEAIQMLDTYVQKNNEEIKQSILKSYPDAIVNSSSNWWAEIKVWNTIMDLSSKELNIIWWNKEKLEKFIEFKSSLDDLGLWFLWKDREILFQNIKNKKWENSINMLDNNVVWEQEFKNILDYIAWKLNIPKKENLDDFKNEFKNSLKSDFLKVNWKEYKSSWIWNVFETALTWYVDWEEWKLIINWTFKKD